MAVLWTVTLLYVCMSVKGIEEYSSTETQMYRQNSTLLQEWKTNCPTNCQCYFSPLPSTAHNAHAHKDLATVDCSDARLTAPPSILPNNTEVVFIFNNFITQLTKLANSPTLLYLDASNNSIDIVNSDTLVQFKKLQFLSIRKNRLTFLPPKVFDALTELYTLDLSENKLENVSGDMFEKLTHLKSLNMAENMLPKVMQAWFKNLNGLRELDLSHNQLTSITSDNFQGLENLNLLNLSNNKIRKIDNSAFNVLHSLLILDLSDNYLRLVPTIPLQSMHLLKKVSLNGNLIFKIHTEDFTNLNVTSLSVSFMSELKIVEKLAFHNMNNLTNIEMHDNEKLIYIDPGAFQNVPNLKTLYLHNNQLTMLSSKLLKYVPNLEQIHLYHNSLRCDCNAFWIRELIEEAKLANISKPFFNHSNFIKCDFPLNVTGVSVADVDENLFKRVCSPTTLPLFHENYTLDLGEELRLECHAYGVPEPTLSWLLPNGSEVHNDITGDKFEIVNKCVLIVRSLNEKDNGVYACKADNGIGYDISSSKISVTNKPVRLVLFRLGYDYISLSWNGTKHSSFISDYQLHYREINNSSFDRSNSYKIKYRVIPLRPQYKSYTVTMLSPNTQYEFCIVYVYDTEYYKVDCQMFKTKANLEFHSAIKKIVSEKIIAGVCTALGLLMALVCMVTLVKKFRLHKDYETPYASEDTESINIPLENVYQPLSTPLCSSKTSLLSVHTGKSHFDEY